MIRDAISGRRSSLFKFQAVEQEGVRKTWRRDRDWLRPEMAHVAFNPDFSCTIWSNKGLIVTSFHRAVAGADRAGQPE